MRMCNSSWTYLDFHPSNSGVYVPGQKGGLLTFYPGLNFPHIPFQADAERLALEKELTAEQLQQREKKLQHMAR